MAFWSWVGFEMAPNYAEESRDPKRIVPLSLYISVIGLGVFYIFVSAGARSRPIRPKATCWPRRSATAATSSSRRSTQFVGGWAEELMSLLILTSSFACGMAFHNTAARYMYSLGREGVLPGLARRDAYDHHKSPHTASFVQSILAAVWVILTPCFNGFDDPNAQAYLGVYTLFAVLGTGLLLGPAGGRLASPSCATSGKNGGGNVFTTMIAPAMSFVVQVWFWSTFWSPISRPSPAPAPSPTASPMSRWRSSLSAWSGASSLKSMNPEGLSQHRPHGERGRVNA